MSKELKTFIEACAEAKTLQNLEDVGRVFLKSIGGADTSFTLGQILGVGGVIQPGPIFGDFEHPWVKYYVENNCVRYDPVPVIAMTVHDDLIWSDIRELSSLTQCQRHLFYAASEFGLPSGVAFPVPQLDGAVFILLVASGRELTLSAVERFLIRSAAAELVRYVRLILNDKDRTVLHLAPRETEVMQHILKGMTNKEIAQEIGVSPETVKDYVSRASQKLNARDRTEAAVNFVRKKLAL